jgi:hypothetical protein
MPAWEDSAWTRGVLAWERVRSFSLAFFVGLGEGADLAEELGARRRTLEGWEVLGSCGWESRDGETLAAALERVRRLVASGSSRVWLVEALRLAGMSGSGG